MRSAALTAGLLVLTLALAAVPVDAKQPLLPETRREARQLVEATFDDADRTAAGALREARWILREARGAIGNGLGAARSLAPENGILDVRATLVQPIVGGSGDFASYVWMGTGDERAWRGAFWVEVQDRVSAPNVLELDDEGSIFAVGEPTALPADHLDITYHFLGTDGTHTVVPAGRAEVLAFLPEEQAPDFGGASLARKHGEVVGVFLTPWNLLGRNATLGLTLAYPGRDATEHTLESCADWTSTNVEPGCRLLYPLIAEPDLASVTLWHLDEEGARVDDRTLTYADLDAGYTFA